MGCSPAKFVNKPKPRRQSLLNIPNNPIKINQINSTIKKFLVLEEKDDPFKFYDNLEFIKQGKYGSIFKVQHKKNKNIRIMKIVNLTGDNEDTITREDLMNQIELLKNLSHPNTIQLYEYFSYNHKIYMLYEYCPGGDLFEYITKTNYLNESQCKEIIQQVLSALKYCHSKHVIHYDLCPEHLVILGTSSFWIKIIDFGAFNLLGSKKTILTSGFKMMTNPYFCPPENIPTEKADIWSTGVLMYFILSGVLPFNGKTIDEIRKNIVSNEAIVDTKAEPWCNVSETAITFMNKLLTKNLEQRPTASDALEDEWFAHMRENNANRICSSEAFKKVVFNIKSYSNDNKIKEGLVYFIMHHLVKNDALDVIRRCFECFDSNNDGMISKDELIAGLVKLSTETQAKIDAEIIFQNLNLRGNCIKYDDFIKASIDKDELITDKNLKYIFELMDKDKSGKISKVELKDFFLTNNQNCHFSNNSSLKEQKTKEDDIFSQFIGEMDSNGDGMLNFGEFKKLMYTCK